MEMTFVKISDEMKKPVLTEADRANNKIDMEKLRALQREYLATFENAEK